MSIDGKQWKITNVFNSDCSEETGVCSIQTVDSNEWHVATIEDAPNHVANANLIAAAPELLEALSYCLEFIELPDECAEKAIAAIKKAKGE